MAEGDQNTNAVPQEQIDEHLRQVAAQMAGAKIASQQQAPQAQPVVGPSTARPLIPSAPQPAPAATPAAPTAGGAAPAVAKTPAAGGATAAPVVSPDALKAVSKQTGFPIGRHSGIPGTIDPATGQPVNYNIQQQANPLIGLAAHAENIHNPVFRVLAKVGAAVGAGVAGAGAPEIVQQRQQAAEAEAQLPGQQAKQKLEAAQADEAAAKAQAARQQAGTAEKAGAAGLFPVQHPDGSITYERSTADPTLNELAKIPAANAESIARVLAGQTQDPSRASYWNAVADSFKASIAGEHPVSPEVTQKTTPLTQETATPYVNQTREIPDAVIAATGVPGKTAAEKRVNMEKSLVGMLPEQAQKAVDTLTKTGEWQAGKDIAATDAAQKQKEATNKRVDDALLKVRQSGEDDTKPIKMLLDQLAQVDEGNQAATKAFQVKFAEHEIVEGGVKRMNETELNALTKSLGSYGRQFEAWVAAGFEGDMPKATKTEMRAILTAESKALESSEQRKEDNIRWTLGKDPSTEREPDKAADGRSIADMQKAGYEWRNGPHGVGWYPGSKK